jgi:tRNA(adenine34) deaminase
MNDGDHERWMKRAIELTINEPKLPFGAVIVDSQSGEVVAEGWNRSAVNPICHGEIEALNSLVRSGLTSHRGDLILYSTAEPCPMCMGAILWCGIDMVVYGTSIAFLLDIGWRQIDIPAIEVARRSPGWRCEVVGGVLESVCNELFLNVSRAAPGW